MCPLASRSEAVSPLSSQILSDPLRPQYTSPAESTPPYVWTRAMALGASRYPAGKKYVAGLPPRLVSRQPVRSISLVSLLMMYTSSRSGSIVMMRIRGNGTGVDALAGLPALLLPFFGVARATTVVMINMGTRATNPSRPTLNAQLSTLDGG